MLVELEGLAHERTTYDHEQVGQESILTKVILPIVKMIVTLLGFVCEVEFGELSESAEAKHCKSSRQAGYGTAATLNRPFEQLTVNVFHVLQHSDKLVLDGSARDNPCLRQHVSTAPRFQLHLIHEVLYTVAIEDTIAVDEEHKQIIVSAKVVLVNPINEAESLLLAVSLAAVRESRDRDSTATIGNVDAARESLKCDGHTEFLNCPQVKLVLVFAIKR